MASSKVVSFRLDEDTYAAVAAYASSAGFDSTTSALKDLISWGLYCRTEKPHASVVQRLVRQELEAFMAEMSLRMELMVDDAAIGIDERLTHRADEAVVLARACLRASSEAAAGAPEELRSADEIRIDAIDAAWAALEE